MAFPFPLSLEEIKSQKNSEEKGSSLNMELELGAVYYKTLVPQESVQVSLYFDIFTIHCNLHGVRTIIH